MSEKIITAGEAVFVSQLNPCTNYAHIPFIAVGFSGCLPFSHCTARCRPCRAENIGLLQFPRWHLPPGGEILSARLYLFVPCALCGDRHIQVYANAEPFSGSTVNWVSRPRMQSAPICALHAERPGVYISCDITQFIKENCSLPDNNWGFSLVPADKCPVGVVLFSKQAGFSPYISINYAEKPSPPCPCQAAESLFNEYIWELDGDEAVLFSQNVEAANTRRITFFIENTGAANFEANLQISPDGINFINDKQVITLRESGAMEAITPYLFAKYMRVRIRPETAGEFVRARIWCQNQTHDYLFR